MVQHTPGPWKVDPAEDLPLAVIQDTPDGLGVAEIVAQGPDGEADARLIAAAPELLETLRNFREWFADHFEAFSDDVNGQLLSLDNDAAAAIAKAEGRAE